MSTLLQRLFLALTLSASLSTHAALVAHWQGEGDFLDSAGGHKGTQHNGVTFAPGKIGQAFSFDGVNDYIDIPDAGGSTSLNLNYQTISMWINPTMSSSSSFAVFPLDKRNGSPNFVGEYAMLIRGNGAYQVVTHTTGAMGFVNGTNLGTIPMNAWSHVAWTWNGNALKVYLNGSEIASDAGTGTILQNSSSLKIGARSDVTSFFKGLIDDLRIYDNALSAPEVGAIMQPVPAPPSLLLFTSALLTVPLYFRQLVRRSSAT